MTRRVGRYHKNFSRAQRDLTTGVTAVATSNQSAPDSEAEAGDEEAHTTKAKAKKKVSQVTRRRARTPKSSRRRLRRG